LSRDFGGALDPPDIFLRYISLSFWDLDSEGCKVDGCKAVLDLLSSSGLMTDFGINSMSPAETVNATCAKIALLANESLTMKNAIVSEAISAAVMIIKRAVSLLVAITISVGSATMCNPTVIDHSDL
jgi:hypothetical protein